MSWEEFQGSGSPTNQQQGQQQQQEQQQQEGLQQRQRVTPISLALAVLRAMDTLRDAICRNSSLPREISEKCEEVCSKLKDMAFDLISYYNSMYSRNNRVWRRRAWENGYRRGRSWKRSFIR